MYRRFELVRTKTSSDIAVVAYVSVYSVATWYHVYRLSEHWRWLLNRSVVTVLVRSNDVYPLLKEDKLSLWERVQVALFKLWRHWHVRSRTPFLY